MKIGILSDIHDNIPQLRKALAALSDCEALICCGDLCSPFIVKELGGGFAGPIHVVFGNNDGDLFRITSNAAAWSQITLHGELAELELSGRRIAVNHFDNIGRFLAKSGRFDLVCYGHNHQFEIRTDGACLVVNPGEVFGGLTGRSTCVRYDTGAGTAECVELG